MGAKYYFYEFKSIYNSFFTIFRLLFKKINNFLIKKAFKTLSPIVHKTANIFYDFANCILGFAIFILICSSIPLLYRLISPCLPKHSVKKPSSIMLKELIKMLLKARIFIPITIGFILILIGSIILIWIEEAYEDIKKELNHADYYLQEFINDINKVNVNFSQYISNYLNNVTNDINSNLIIATRDVSLIVSQWYSHIMLDVQTILNNILQQLGLPEISININPPLWHPSLILGFFFFFLFKKIIIYRISFF